MCSVEETNGVVYIKGDTVLPAYQEVDIRAIVKGARGIVEVIAVTPKTGNRSSKWRIANAITDISRNYDIIVKWPSFCVILWYCEQAQRLHTRGQCQKCSV
jgi:hypothetical protein